MANAGNGIGKVFALLLPFLRGYASGGLAAGGAAVACSLAGLGTTDTALVTATAAAAGQRVGEWVERLRRRREAAAGVADGTGLGGVIDDSAGQNGGPGSLPPYRMGIKSYCGHDGQWHFATVSCRTIGQAKGGGWWKAEALDGRVYDLDADQWL